MKRKVAYSGSLAQEQSLLVERGLVTRLVVGDDVEVSVVVVD